MCSFTAHASAPCMTMASHWYLCMATGVTAFFTAFAPVRVSDGFVLEPVEISLATDVSRAK